MNRPIPGGPLFKVPDLDSIPGMISRAAGEHPDNTAVSEIMDDGSISILDYGTLRSDMELLAGGLLRNGDGRPVAGIAGRNSISWCRAYLGILRAGGIAVPIDRELPFEEMCSILRRSGADTVFLDAAAGESFRDDRHCPGIRRISLDGDSGNGFETIDSVAVEGRQGNAPLPSASASTSGPAVICYTSGTTGRSKGVVLSQANLLADIRQMYQFIRIRSDDTFLSVLPFHHTYECTCGFLGPLSLGASVFICRGLRKVMEDLCSSRATVILGVPLLWETIYRRVMNGIAELPGGRLKLHMGMAVAGTAGLLGFRDARKKVFRRVHDRFGGALRLMISGGAAIDPAVVRGFEKLGFRFLQGYGLTETSPIVSVNRVDANRYGSVGPPLPNMEVRILDPDYSGTGEIAVRGPNVMIGYHEDPEATAEVLSGDGWFRTGDFGHLDGDGFLFVTGRKKNVIVAKNGKNVYPEEIETVLNRSPAVMESMVFGRKSPRKGEEIWALAVPDPDGLEGENPVEAIRGVMKRYNASTASYRRIAAFMVREEELPRTTTRKVRRLDVFPDGEPSMENAHRA